MINFRACCVYAALFALMSAVLPCAGAKTDAGPVEDAARKTADAYMHDLVLDKIDGLLSSGGTKEVFAYIDAALVKVPEDEKLLFIILKIETAIIDSGRGSRDGFRNKMRELAGSGNYAEAIDLCAAVLSVSSKTSPEKTENRVWIMTMVADAYNRAGNPEAALSILSEAQKLTDTCELHMAKGGIYVSESRFKEANAEYAAALEFKGADAGIYEAKAWTLREMGKIRESEQDLLAGLSSDPDNKRLLRAAAYHYRDRRYFKKSFDYIKRYLDADNPSKQKYPENRNFRDIYYKTDFDGYRMTPNLSASLSNEYYSEISNIENMLRGVKSSDIDIDESDKLPVPHNTRRDKMDAKITVRPEKYFPVTHFYLDVDKSFARIDPLVEKQRTYYMMELEKTYYTPLLGDVTLYPYFKYSYIQGTDIDVRSMFTSEFNIEMYNPAIRALACPDFGKFYIESEYVYGFGNFVDSDRDLNAHQGRLKFTNVFSDSSWHSAELAAYYTKQEPSRDSDLRLQFISELDKSLTRKLRWVMLNKVIYHKDYLTMQPDQNVLIYNPVTGLCYAFNDNIKAKGTVGYFMDFDIKKYNYLTSDLSVSYYGKLSPVLLVGNSALRYDTPVELTIGYRNDNFLEFPADARTGFNSIYCRAKLFW